MSPGPTRHSGTVAIVRRTCLWALVAAAAAVGVSQFLPRTYRAQAKILPAPTGSGLLGAGSDLIDASGIGGLLGGSLGGSENPVLTFPEILLSRPILEGLPPAFKVNVRTDPSGHWLESSILHLVEESVSGRVGSESEECPGNGCYKGGRVLPDHFVSGRRTSNPRL